MGYFFSSSDNALFFRLLLSQLLTAFILQPNHWPASIRPNLNKWLYTLIQGLLAGVLAFAFTGGSLRGYSITLSVIVLVGTSYCFINQLQLNYGAHRPLRSFVIGHSTHILVLLVVWLWLTDGWANSYRLIEIALADQRFLAVLCGYLICTTPLGFLIGIITRKWRSQLSQMSTPIDPSGTLAEAGKWIGIAERTMIFSFVLLAEYEAIGFLIAAKSILRFKDSGDGPGRAEYVLVGTMLSYGLAILLGLMTKLTIE